MIMRCQLNAFRVLEDAKRAYEILENIDDDDQLFRITWFSCVGLLRTVAEVLKHDAEKNKFLKSVWNKRFKELNALAKKYEFEKYTECPKDFLFWTRLFQLERNFIAHEYQFGYADYDTQIAVVGSSALDSYNYVVDANIYRPMDDIEMYGDLDCRDWILDAIKWWENELASLCQKIN